MPLRNGNLSQPNVEWQHATHTGRPFPSGRRPDAPAAEQGNNLRLREFISGNRCNKTSIWSSVPSDEGVEELEAVASSAANTDEARSTVSLAGAGEDGLQCGAGDADSPKNRVSYRGWLPLASGLAGLWQPSERHGRVRPCSGRCQRVRFYPHSNYLTPSPLTEAANR